MNSAIFINYSPYRRQYRASQAWQSATWGCKRYGCSVLVAVFLGCSGVVWAADADTGRYIAPDASAAYLSELAQLNSRYGALPQAVAAFEAAIAKAESDEERGRNAFSLAQVLYQQILECKPVRSEMEKNNET